MFAIVWEQESLVTSISGSFANAMKTKATRLQFLDQCFDLLTQLQNTLASERQKLEAEVKKRDAMTSEQQKLVGAPCCAQHYHVQPPSKIRGVAD
jgi:hypothetical protein